MSEQKDYTGYEYKQITADAHMESLWRNSMASFGWSAEKSQAKVVSACPSPCGSWQPPSPCSPGSLSRSS